MKLSVADRWRKKLLITNLEGVNEARNEVHDKISDRRVMDSISSLDKLICQVILLLTGIPSSGTTTTITYDIGVGCIVVRMIIAGRGMVGIRSGWPHRISVCTEKM